MFTVKEYYTRKVIGIFATKCQAQKAITELGLMWHHVKGKTIIAIR